MMRLISLAASVLLATAPVWAEPYWITYEGNDFPENEGWAHIWSLPLAERWIEDGALVIDSRASGATNDWYEWYPEWLNPEPEELFIAEWRLRVDELTIGWRDPSAGVFGDDSWGVGFNFNEDTIVSVYEDDVSAHFEPYVFHNFELRTADMRTYQLYIDGSLAIQGDFWDSLSSSRVGWGDTVSGGASLTHWDYFRFGVVPEPSVLWLFAAGLVTCVLRTVRGRMRRVVLLPVLACVLSGSASAEPYWIAYEADDFPENEGWWHIWGPEPGERWIEDGVFVLDTLRDTHIADFYVKHMWGSLDPGPGETFVMQWRLLIEEAHGPDIGVTVFSDERWAVAFSLDEDTITSIFEQDVSAPLEPGAFHEFELRSCDVRTYDLYLDGVLTIEGSFWLSVTDSEVNWGDSVQGASSLSRWDYVRFGVVPEPAAALSMVALLGLGLRARGTCVAREPKRHAPNIKKGQ